jgi:hypothetical protein
VYDELKRIWKETVVTYFKAKSQNLYPGNISSPVPPEHKSEFLNTRLRDIDFDYRVFIQIRNKTSLAGRRFQQPSVSKVHAASIFRVKFEVF